MIEELLKILNLFDNSPFYEYENIIKNNKYKKLKKYCQYAKSKKNTNDFYYYLGNAFCCVEKNYEEAIKYYKMAIDKNNSSAMNNLGRYYDNIEENYEEIIQAWKEHFKV